MPPSFHIAFLFIHTERVHAGDGGCDDVSDATAAMHAAALGLTQHLAKAKSPQSTEHSLPAEGRGCMYRV